MAQLKILYRVINGLRKIVETYKIEELEMVDLIYSCQVGITENAIRAERGLDLRAVY